MESARKRRDTLGRWQDQRRRHVRECVFFSQVLSAYPKNRILRSAQRVSKGRLFGILRYSGRLLLSAILGADNFEEQLFE